ALPKLQNGSANPKNSNSAAELAELQPKEEQKRSEESLDYSAGSFHSRVKAIGTVNDRAP
ncbi:MAG TPA: hypothetical protein VGR97_10925, partial [Candidatus Acidoferrales bacterium]|nr:hypothetical protein [Candidatus Acidoferrales bacterium]